MQKHLNKKIQSLCPEPRPKKFFNAVPAGAFFCSPGRSFAQFGKRLFRSTGRGFSQSGKRLLHSTGRDLFLRIKACLHKNYFSLKSFTLNNLLT